MEWLMHHIDGSTRKGSSPLILRYMLGAAIVVWTTVAQAQNLYRWVDRDGKVTYSQNPPPAGAAAKVERKRLQDNVVTGGGALPFEVQQAARTSPVSIYTSPE